MIAKLFNGYTFLLWWIGLMAVFAQSDGVMTTVDVLGRKERRVNLFFAVLVFFPIFRLAAFGPKLGDVWMYLSSYEKMPDRLSVIGTYLREHHSGFGYVIIEQLIKYFSGGSETAYRVCFAAIHSLPVILILRRYSEDYVLSVFLFVAQVLHIGWMMNGLRQFVAVVIIFSATPFFLKKRYVPTILIVLLATTIHTSALIMLPVIFVAQGKVWNWKTVLSILAAVIAMYVFSRNVALFDNLIENTEYENTIQELHILGDDGSNPIRILVSAVPVIIAFLGRKQLNELNDPVINLCVNMSIITMCIYMVASVTSGILTGRLPVYTELYGLILLPGLIRHVFTRESARIMTIAMAVLYLVYYSYATG